jgi:hypothetical protein
MGFQPSGIEKRYRKCHIPSCVYQVEEPQMHEISLLLYSCRTAVAVVREFMIVTTVVVACQIMLPEAKTFSHR